MEDLSPSPNVTPASIPSSVARPLALCAAAADASVDASATAKAAVAMGLNARAGLDPRNDGRPGLVCVTIDVNSPLRVSIWRVPTARASGQEGGIYRAASGECANHALTSSLLLLAGFAEAGFRTAYLCESSTKAAPNSRHQHSIESWIRYTMSNRRCRGEPPRHKRQRRRRTVLACSIGVREGSGMGAD